MVELTAYDPEWPARFEREAARLRRALGDVAIRIEHVGSTAVPGFTAKPIVDIQISVRSFEPLDAYAAPLTRLGYVYRGPLEDPEHRFFYLADAGRRVVNLHVCESGGAWEGRHIEFRDALRRDPELAARYLELKQRLAERFPDDALAYAEAKDPFMREVERELGIDP